MISENTIFKKSLFLFSILLYYIYPQICFSQLPLITDNTGIQGKGNGQLEISNGVGFNSEHRCIENSSEVSPVLTFGVCEKSDIVLCYPFLVSTIYNDSGETKYAGFSDLSIEIKYNFIKFRNITLAIKPGITFPSGNYRMGLGSGKFSETFFLITSAEFSSITINGNIGYLRNKNKCGDALNIWHASADMDVKISNEFHLVLNTGIEKNPDIESSTNPIFGLGGLYYCLSDKCEISLGYEHEFKMSETNHSFIYGLTLRF